MDIREAVELQEYIKNMAYEQAETAGLDKVATVGENGRIKLIERVWINKRTGGLE